MILDVLGEIGRFPGDRELAGAPAGHRRFGLKGGALAQGRRWLENGHGGQGWPGEVHQPLGRFGSFGPWVARAIPRVPNPLCDVY